MSFHNKKTIHSYFNWKGDRAANLVEHESGHMTHLANPTFFPYVFIREARLFISTNGGDILFVYSQLDSGMPLLTNVDPAWYRQHD